MKKMKDQTQVSSESHMKISSKRLRFFAPTAFCIALALTLLLWLLHFAPFYALSYFFWIGIIITLIGLISLIRPLRFLFVFNRKIAAAVCCGGLLLSAICLLWPVPLLHSEGSQQHIDALMPEYSFREYHEVQVQASPNYVMQTMRQVSISDIPTVRFLLRLRELAGGKREDIDHSRQKKSLSESQSTQDSGFFSDANEFVSGKIMKSWVTAIPPRMTTAEQFISFKDSGYIKVAFNFYVKNLGNGKTLLSSETRIHANDDKARRIFGRYWTIIYPGSAITRRLLLDAVATRVESP
jgi:multisubunit Na+/H+ antiporter MnhB subunit